MLGNVLLRCCRRAVKHYKYFMFKKIFLMVFLSAFAMSGFAQRLNSGSMVQVRVINSTNSKDAGALSAVVAYDVANAGKVLIEQGTPVVLDVTKKRARGVGKPGVITVYVLSTTAVDGQTIAFGGEPVKFEGKKKKGLAIGLGVGLGVGCLCPPLLACLAIKGGQAEVTAGTMLNAIVTSTYEVKAK